MIKNEELAKNLASLLLIDFNPYSKFPLTYRFHNEETDGTIEIKRKLESSILTYLNTSLEM